jgi:hypothetical protein
MRYTVSFYLWPIRADVSQSYAAHLLMYMAYWIGLCLEHLEEDQGTPAGLTSPYLITANHLCWTFALLARVEDSPSADDMAQMRGLARGCISLIKLAEKGGPVVPLEEKAETVSDDATTLQDCVSSCWMIVACITGIWAQHDLWEEAEEAMTVLSRK